MNLYPIRKHKKLVVYVIIVVLIDLLPLDSVIRNGGNRVESNITLAIGLAFLLPALYKARPYHVLKSKGSKSRDLRIPSDFSKYPLFKSHDRCGYSATYFDHYNNKETKYHCHQKPLRSGLCIFHDDGYWRDNTSDAKHAFQELVRNAIAKNEPLVCIGYAPLLEIPSPLFSVGGGGMPGPISFSQPAYFLACNFESISLLDSTFSFIDFSFSKCKSARFECVQFAEKSRFASCEFNFASFADSVFHKAATFTQTKFTTRPILDDKGTNSIVHTGIGDFDYTIFKDDVDFSGCRFHSNARFYQTVFFGKANFSLTSIKVKEVARTFKVAEVFDNVAFAKELRIDGISLS